MVLWLLALAFPVLINPYASGHLSLCLFKNMGFGTCPGCGLGRAIALLYHGDIIGSLQMHPLGIPAVIMIMARIVALLRRSYYKFSIYLGGQHG